MPVIQGTLWPMDFCTLSRFLMACSHMVCGIFEKLRHRSTLSPQAHSSPQTPSQADRTFLGEDGPGHTALTLQKRLDHLAALNKIIESSDSVEASAQNSGKLLFSLSLQSYMPLVPKSHKLVSLEWFFYPKQLQEQGFFFKEAARKKSSPRIFSLATLAGALDSIAKKRYYLADWCCDSEAHLAPYDLSLSYFLYGLW